MSIFLLFTSSSFCYLVNFTDKLIIVENEVTNYRYLLVTKEHSTRIFRRKKSMKLQQTTKGGNHQMKKRKETKKE